FTSSGDILARLVGDAGSLSRPEGDSPQILADFITNLVSAAGLELAHLDSVNLGVAGITNDDAREQLFKELDRLRLSDRIMVASDVEAAYEVVWGADPGVLACVGTGAICWARGTDGSTYRSSGLGPGVGGDPGSGYWLGRNVMVQLMMNENAEDDHLAQVRQEVISYYGARTFEQAAAIAGDSAHQITRVAGMAEMVCRLAAEGNELALSLVQEGTQALSDDLLGLIDEAGLRRDDMTIGIHGSIIVKSEVFIDLLGRALSYDFKSIKWKQPEFDPVFGAAFIAAGLNDFAINRTSLKANLNG
ncbi:MAG: hypothetical protein KAU50_00690, partial [Candidatus Marinimicrobia bacterium]|nr:hypothetical protein [Candidatus Neomarinimicrobiota bacterium]